MKEIALIIVPFLSVVTSVFVLMLCLTHKKSLFFVITSFVIMTAVTGLILIPLIFKGYFDLSEKIKNISVSSLSSFDCFAF